MDVGEEDESVNAPSGRVGHRKASCRNRNSGALVHLM